MPTFEFDRLEPDLTLNEIIQGKKRLRKLRETLALTGHSTPKPPVTHMNRTVLLRRLTEFDARLGKIAKSKSGKVTEFAFAPTLIGGAVGSGVGAKLSGKKLNPKTGKWEDAEGNEVSAPVVSSGAGAATGAGVGYGASKLHQSIMGNYGGQGGAGQAYKNVARNVATQAGEKVSSVIGPTATTATQDIYGVGKSTAEDVLKKLKGAGTAALKKVFGARAPSRFIELEARIDAIVFGDPPSRGSDATGKKKVSDAGRAVREFAQGDEKKSSRSKLIAGAYLGGLATPTLARAGLRLRRGKPPLPTGPGSYMRAMSPEFHEWLDARQTFKSGEKIPPNKVADFLMRLHKATTATKVKV